MKYVKVILSVLTGAFLVWVFTIYKSNENNKSVAKSQSENVRQLILEKELLQKKLQLNNSQFEEYLKVNKDLNEKVSKLGIKLKRIESLTSARFKYKDTIINRIDLTSVLDSVELNKYAKLNFVDTLTPVKIKGFVEHNNGKLSVNITERSVNANLTYVRYWYRKWFLGRKHYTSETISEFGDFNITYIEKKK
jgi:hypothetical protein